MLKFPDGFLWGVSTSAFQVEGNPAEIMQRRSDWADWTAQESRIADKSTADQACQFYERYVEDIDLTRSLNCNSFRLGLNWAALAPVESADKGINSEVLAYYHRVFDRLKAAGLTTFVTLFHFCLPRWLSDIGGWENPRTIEEFESFARIMASEFGTKVDYWLTINEPLVYGYQGYVTGDWPPGLKKKYIRAFAVVRNLLEGHARAYRAIKTSCPDSPVSYTLHWRPFAARHNFNPLDQVVRYFRDQVFNHVFPTAVERGYLQFPYPLSEDPAIKAISGPIEGLKGSIDYVAINYFTREICEFKPGWPIDLFGVQSPVVRLEASPIGWEIYPQGLYYLLTEDLAPYRLDANGRKRPIIITENGMGDMYPDNLAGGDWSLDDSQRIRYLTSHLLSIHQAIAQGANVTGYLHWSLTDNFEWSDGLRARFGLVRLGYPTQERRPRKSAATYAEIVGSNALNPDHIFHSVLNR